MAGHGGPRPGAGRKPVDRTNAPMPAPRLISRLKARDGHDDIRALVGMVLIRLDDLDSDPNSAPTYGELRDRLSDRAA